MLTQSKEIGKFGAFCRGFSAHRWNRDSRQCGQLSQLYPTGGFHTWGIPNSWTVSFMENPTEMDDD